MVQRNQPPLRLLSLDGGGIRGYSMLLLLREVMVKLFIDIEGRAPRKWEIPRPCDYFDLIGGTGTGGLIALLLGRLRLDVDTALHLYARLSRKVFETNKTVAGVPYRKTLFKASKLEGAIKEVVRLYDSNDTADHRKRCRHSSSPGPGSVASRPKKHGSLSAPSKISNSDGSLALMEGDHYQTPRQNGNEDGILYDERPGRCRTFMTAVYKGSGPDTPPALLRSYNCPTESTSCGTCKMWEAGRATCATYPAFKGIQIEDDIFLDEGIGRFNPAPVVLGEAMANWPNRDIGVIVSIGSGKRPPLDSQSKTRSNVRSSIVEHTPLQKFVEARERHISKILDCEKIHQEMLKDLSRMGIGEMNYFRLNVDYGVGEHGMNAYTKMADISTCTKAYLAKSDIQMMTKNCAEKLAAIHRQKNRLHFRNLSRDILDKVLPSLPKLPDANVDADPSRPTTSQTPHSPRHSESKIVANIVAEFNRLPPNPFAAFDPTVRTASPDAFAAVMKVAPKRKEVPSPLRRSSDGGQSQDSKEQENNHTFIGEALKSAASCFSDSTTSSVNSSGFPPTPSNQSTTFTSMTSARSPPGSAHNISPYMSYNYPSSPSLLSSPMSLCESSFSSPKPFALATELEEEIAQQLTQLANVTMKLGKEFQEMEEESISDDCISTLTDNISQGMGRTASLRSTNSTISCLSVTTSSRTDSRFGDRILGCCEKADTEEAAWGEMTGHGNRREDVKRGLRVSERLPINYRSNWVPPDCWETLGGYHMLPRISSSNNIK